MSNFKFKNLGPDANPAGRHLRLAAASAIVKGCKWLRDASINKSTLGDGSVVVEGHVLEALCCFGMHGEKTWVAGMLANRAQNVLFKWQLVKAFMSRLIRFMEDQGAFAVVSNSFSQTAELFLAMHREHNRAPELFCTAADWQRTADHASVRPNELADFDLHLAMSVPLVFKGAEKSLSQTADLMAGMGVRYSAALFRDA